MTSHLFMLRIPLELWDRLIAAAKRDHRSVADYLKVSAIERMEREESQKSSPRATASMSPPTS